MVYVPFLFTKIMLREPSGKSSLDILGGLSSKDTTCMVWINRYLPYLVFPQLMGPYWVLAREGLGEAGPRGGAGLPKAPQALHMTAREGPANVTVADERPGKRGAGGS